MRYRSALNWVVGERTYTDLPTLGGYDMRRRLAALPRPVRLMALGVVSVFVFAACDPIFYNAAVEHEQNDPATRPWWCDSTGGGHGDHMMDPDPYEGVVKGMLSWDDCKTVSLMFDMARTYVENWPTAADAEADGWYQVVPYASGMGTHHARVDDMLNGYDDVFKAWEPEFLMYDDNGPSAELTGMAWWVQSSDGPPAGFPGDNDWWHQHPGICLTQSLTWMGQGWTEQGCLDAGGVWANSNDKWMVHAWILPNWELHFDVFQNHHPCLEGGVTTDPNDPCWDEAEMGPDHGG